MDLTLVLHILGIVTPFVASTIAILRLFLKNMIMEEEDRILTIVESRTMRADVLNEKFKTLEQRVRQIERERHV